MPSTVARHPLLGDLFERCGGSEASARVGDQDIDRAEAVLDLAAHRFDGAEAGDIAGHCDGFAAVAADAGDDAGHGVLVSSVHGDSGAAPGELGDDGLPDSP